MYKSVPGDEKELFFTLPFCSSQKLFLTCKKCADKPFVKSLEKEFYYQKFMNLVVGAD